MTFTNKTIAGFLTEGLIGYPLVRLWKYFKVPKTENNTSEDVPTGMVLKVTKAAGILEDGDIYIVGKDDKVLESIVHNYLTDCDNHGVKNGWCLEHEVHCISENDILKESKVLFAEKNNYNVVIPLFTPNSLEKQFLLANVSTEEVADLIPELINQSEDICKAAMFEAMKNLAMQEPDSINALVKSIVSKLAAEEGTNINNISDVRYCRAYTPSLCGIDLTTTVTFEQRMEKFNNYLRNRDVLMTLENRGNKLTKDELNQKDNLSKDIKFVEGELGWNCTTWRVVHNALKAMGDGRKNFYENSINRYSIAKRCPLAVGVLTVPNGKWRSNAVNARYRVYLKMKENVVTVNFLRSTSLLIYIMYLIDRKNNKDNSVKIDFKKNVEAYESLCKIIYPHKDNVKNEFEKLVNNLRLIDQNGYTHTMNKPINVDFSETRKVLELALEELNQKVDNGFKDDIDSFLLTLKSPSIYSHITILPENIILPKEIEDIEIKL